MSYYMPSPHPSHIAPPVMYTSSHHSGRSYLPPQPAYDPGYGYGAGQPYVVSAPSSRSHRHSRHYRDVRLFPNFLDPITHLALLSNQHDGGHRSHGRSHSRHQHHHHRHRSLGERILRWFGIGRHRSRHHKGSGLFGSNRTRYVDSRGIEVDHQGRPVYAV